MADQLHELYERFRAHLYHDARLGLSVDVSRIRFAAGFFEAMEPRVQKAFAAMAELEAGAIANPDEKRRVGHYWLRAPELAPDAATRAAIEDTLATIHAFAKACTTRASGPSAPRASRTCSSSASAARRSAPSSSPPRSARRATGCAPSSSTTPTPTASTASSTPSATGSPAPSPWSSRRAAAPRRRATACSRPRAQYERLGLRFGKHAVAVTGEGSELDNYAVENGFLARFPMWDWVGGRTSELSAVGLLPAALQGLDIDAMLAGARAMDVATRARDTRKNPAALLALAWYSATGGAGKKDMVLLPYKDRLELFSRYLQQLVMESLGKRQDLAGKVVHQGIAVYGNKGSTDQHAYVQQLRDGLDNFFVTFIEVLRDRAPERGVLEVEPGVTSGDYLSGFLQGTRKALTESGRESITITLDDGRTRAPSASSSPSTSAPSASTRRS